jgi:syndecan 1
VGAAECCTPALLLESGDAWELERCNCVASEDVDCGGANSGRLLQGFVRWRCSPSNPEPSFRTLSLA